MPIFTFNCECGNSYKELAKAGEEVKCDSCGKINTAAIPSAASTIVMETRDSYRGKQVKKGNEAQLKDRMNRHHDKYEVAEKIDRFGMNEAIKHGWLKKAKKL